MFFTPKRSIKGKRLIEVITSNEDENGCFLESSLEISHVGGMVLLEKSGGGVRPASQNPYPFYGKNL